MEFVGRHDSSGVCNIGIGNLRDRQRDCTRMTATPARRIFKVASLAPSHGCRKRRSHSMRVKISRASLRSSTQDSSTTGLSSSGA